MALGCVRVDQPVRHSAQGDLFDLVANFAIMANNPMIMYKRLLDSGIDVAVILMPYESDVNAKL